MNASSKPLRIPKQQQVLTVLFFGALALLPACGTDDPFVDALETTWDGAGSGTRSEICGLVEADTAQAMVGDLLIDTDGVIRLGLDNELNFDDNQGRREQMVEFFAAECNE